MTIPLNLLHNYPLLPCCDLYGIDMPSYLLIGTIVQGSDVDMRIFNGVLNLQETYDLQFPEGLKGSIGFQRCSCIIKRTFPVWWQANGITIFDVKDLITCDA